MKRNLRPLISLFAMLSMVLLTVSVFAVTPQKKILYNFTGGTDGAYPYAGFVVGAGGVLYSTTGGGGLDYCEGGPCGVVFSFTPPQGGGTWTETPIYSWEGGYPTGSTTGVVFDHQGNLYGTSVNVMYQLVPPQNGGSWTYHEVIYTPFFQLADPAVDAADNLYYTYGDAYELSPNSNGTWTSTTIAVNAGDTTLAMDRQGHFYGSNSTGGKLACGTSGTEDCGSIFELVQSDGLWSYRTIYQFQNNSTGYFPLSTGLALDAEGNLYGNAQLADAKCAGGDGCAIVFKLSRPTVEGEAWSESPLHAFEGGNDGFWLNAALSVDSKGSVYGTTIQGGSGFCLSNGANVGCGTAFQLKPPAEPGGPWTETFYSFQGGSDGYWPEGSLLVNEKTGVVYGTTVFGGSYNSGTIFGIDF